MDLSVNYMGGGGGGAASSALSPLIRVGRSPDWPLLFAFFLQIFNF